MYVWLGANIDEQLMDFKKNIFGIAKQNNLTTQLEYHPAHISLIISFETKDINFENIVSNVCEYYNTLSNFDVEPSKIEIENDILWLRHEENSNLIKIHNDLCDLVSTNHKIKLHPFDFQFKYHTTLFLNANKIDNEIIDKIKKLEIPGKITINELFVGFSNDNKSENYKIFKSVKLRSC